LRIIIFVQYTAIVIAIAILTLHTGFFPVVVPLVCILFPVIPVIPIILFVIALGAVLLVAFNVFLCVVFFDFLISLSLLRDPLE
jgi:hypothetical protein